MTDFESIEIVPRRVISTRGITTWADGSHALNNLWYEHRFDWPFIPDWGWTDNSWSQVPGQAAVREAL